jgi:ribonuclease R
VYFTERAVHMFPHELATGLCSLNPRVDRLVQTCQMEVDRRGQVVRYEMHDGVINSDERMTYTDVNAILTGRTAPPTWCAARYAPLVPFFELMHELFAVLNGRRRRRGAIDFDLPEAEVVLARTVRSTTSWRASATSPTASSRSSCCWPTRRWPRTSWSTGAVAAPRARAARPAEGGEFEAFIAPLGYSLRQQRQGAQADALPAAHRSHEGHARGAPIAALMLRTMQKARYDAVSLGHFGLRGRALHPLHVADPPLSRPGRAPHAPPVAAGPIPWRGSRSSKRSCPRPPNTPPTWSGGRRRRA